MGKSRLEGGVIVPPSHLELIVVDHCNLSCRACNHASPAVEKWSADPDAIHRDLSILAKYYRPGFVKVIGGEPVLHGNLPAVIRAAREAKISDYFLLVTNGTLLHKMDDAVWEEVEEVEISSYAGVQQTDANLILAREKARTFGKKLTVNRYDRFRAAYTSLGTDDTSLVQRIYASCKMANVWGCHAFRDGYIYRCPQGIHVAALVGPMAESDRIRVVETPEFQADLFAFLNSTEPLSRCRFCVGTVGKHEAHAMVPRGEWRAHIAKPTEDLVDYHRLGRALIEQEPYDDCKIPIEVGAARDAPAAGAGGARRVRAIWGRRALRERIAFRLRSVFAPFADAPLRLLSARPVVLHAMDWAFLPGTPTFRLLGALEDRRVDILCNLSSNHTGKRKSDRLIRLDWRLRRRGDHRFTVLASSTAEQRLFEQIGLSSVHVSQNALVDEEIYRPLPDREVRFDAVYDAGLAPVKRHQLAAEVPRLALITYLGGRIDERYRAAIEPVLARAHIYNGDPFSDDYRRLSREEVNRALNECAVGLCLSRVEGAMYASIQYLLAGLPVVSTKSMGGRDEFFHPDYVRIVEATPGAVAAAVAELRECPLAPDEIRERTLERVWIHRRRLFECVDRIYADQGVDRSFEAEWPSVFVDKLGVAEQNPTAKILAAIEAAHAS